MSIIAAAVRWERSVQVLLLVLTVGATLLSIAVFLASGAWRPRSIRGPRRLRDDEPIGPLVMIMLGGMSLWLFVPVMSLKLLHRGQPLDQIKPTQTETVVLGVVGPAVALFFMMLGTVTRRRDGFASLGLSPHLARRAVGPAIAGAVFIIPLVGWVAFFTDWFFDKFRIEHPVKHELLEILDVTPARWVRVMIVIGAVLVAPAFEEFIFRGHLQTILVRITRARWLAVIVASMLFALVHEHWSIRIPIFVLSLAFGYMYERTGSLWVPMFMHAVFNGLSIIGSYLASH